MKKLMRLTGSITLLLLFCYCVNVVGQTADSSATQQAGVNQQATAENVSSDSAGQQAPASATTVTSETTDGSGSPAILSGNSGRDRDGTNNVQRASMNMVGASTENLNLDDENSVDPDTEMQDRLEYSQDKRESEEQQPDGGGPG